MIHAKERPDILFRRYFQDRLKKDALEFWKIMPKQPSLPLDGRCFR
jgi:hypothetical protein